MARLWVGAQHLLNELFGSLVLQGGRESEIPFENFLVDLVSAVSLSTEWQVAVDELVEHDSHRPEVYQLVILLSLHHLWSHVMRRTYYGRRPMIFPYPF